MNADKVKRLRHEAEVLRKHGGLRNWATAANLMIEISDELERLGKIEAAEWRDKPTVPGLYAISPEDDFGGVWTLVRYDQTAIDNGAPYYSGSVYGPIPKRGNPCPK